MIGRSVIDHFTSGSVDEIHVVYNCFVNIAQQEVKSETLLPLSYDEDGTVSDRLYEPSKEQLVEALIPRHLISRFGNILLESYASEQAATNVVYGECHFKCWRYDQRFNVTI